MHPTLEKILPLGAAALLALSTAAIAADVSLSGDFAGENGATNHPSGHVDATLDTVTHKLRYTITYDGLTGPVVIAHFHGPAQPGVSAGALKLIPGPYVSGMSNTVAVDAATQSALISNLAYVNLHTHEHPKGEARAQMAVSQSPGM